jgi:hypothetical protein
MLDRLPESTHRYISQIDRIIEKIQTDGVNTKEFRTLMNDYNRSVKEAAKVNIN